MKIALASPRSLSDGLQIYSKLAAKKKASILCFPETFLPGYPGMGEETDPQDLKGALLTAQAIAKKYHMALILPMRDFLDYKKYNLAYVIDQDGQLLGYQTKNQLDPTEDDIWEAGTDRRVFHIHGLCFGISICHEGFRYPESMRWCARNGAQVVFHPHFTGNNVDGLTLEHFADKDNPYYEKAMQCRALENTIYIASVNFSSAFPESATAIIDPQGACLAYQPYREAGVLVHDFDLSLATGLLAKRYKPIHS